MFFGFVVVFLIAFMILFRGSRVAVSGTEDREKRLRSINNKIIITVVMFLMIQNFYLYVNMNWEESEPYKKYLFFGLIGFNIFIVFFFLVYSWNKRRKKNQQGIK